MSLRETVRSLLANDATISSLLPGGVHAVVEISRTEAESAFDATTKELLACANVKLAPESPVPPHRDTVESFFTVSWYQRSGTDKIDPARERGRELLHRKRITGTVQVFHVTLVPDQEDEALEANLHLDRYRAVRAIS